MIVYEEAELLVCQKPAGVDSESGMPALLRLETGAEELYCVHRLDRETAGLMVYAKTKRAAAALSAAVAAHEMHKEYLAAAQGEAPPAGEMTDLLYRDAKKNKSYVVKRMRRGVREAALRYETLGYAEGLSLVRVMLQTGRSHQIRVQFASRGFPLVGDTKYGSAWRETSLALFASALAFPHPLTRETLRFSASPPAVWPWTLFADRALDISPDIR